MYSVYDIAEYVIKRCNEQGKSISNLKLQKILYFIQAEFLVRTGEPIFEDAIEAWDFGPVVPGIYVEYRAYGSASIPYLDEGKKFPFTQEHTSILDGVIDACSSYSAIQLVEITHKQAPWRMAYKRSSRKVISNDSIKAYFME